MIKLKPIAVALVFFLMCSRQSEASIRIVISYNIVWHINPELDNPSSDSMTFKLNGHDVKISSPSDGQGSAKEIGSQWAVTDGNGLQHVSNLHIQNGNIVLRSDYTDHTITTVIRMNGHDSCTATRKYDLKNGYHFAQERYYKTGDKVQILGKTYSDIVCSINTE